jgi:YD repeat-containing protein
MDNVELEPFYDKRRGKWRLQYVNPGGSQVQAVYNEDGVMLEWDTQMDAILWAFDYHASKIPGADEYGPVDYKAVGGTSLDG